MNSPLVYAYIGDAVYEKYVREYLINKGLVRIKELQHSSLDFVSANSQRRIYEDLVDNNVLSEEEIEIAKWGRNAKGHRAKHADIVTYRIATGLECLIGYLYMQRKYERLDSIMNAILK